MPFLINAYSTFREAPPLQFPHELNNRRDRSDPELDGHLEGFIGYILQNSEEEMTQAKYHLLRHIQRVQNHLSLNVNDDDMDGYSRWAEEACAVSFLPDGTVRDPAGNILFTPGGEPDENARIPFAASGVRRKLRTEAQLKRLGIQVPASLPPVISEEEVSLREPAEVAQRTLALFLACVQAESLGSGDPIALSQLQERMPLGYAALTSAEKVFLQSESPPQQDVVNFAWRYEALAVLQWSLGLADELPFPTAICNVPAVARAALDNHSESFIRSAKLRPAEEILEELDLHLRLHWVVRQARIDHRDPPAGLEPGVVAERHHALNWLVRFEDREWDDVDTPT